MTRRLLEPILEGGVRHPNFVNGLVLTAEALAAEQRAGRSLHRHLGRAFGPGIVNGLEVRLILPGSTTTLPQIGVTGGLAINALGDTLALSPGEVVLEPAQPAEPPPPPAGLFGNCEAGTTPGAGTRGTFVLALGPASGFAEKTPHLDLVAKTPSPGCAHRYAVEGVRFKLIPLPLPSSISGDAARLRNLIAHHCFGTPELSGRPHDPFAVPVPHGALAALAATASSGLDACDVPLAILSWPTAAIAFADPWAARRRLQGTNAAPLWPQHLARRTAEAEAILFQFEDELALLVATGGAPTTTATHRFRYLPAAGYLPLGPGRFVSDTFFAGLTVERRTLDEAFVRQIVEASWTVEPLDLDTDPPIALHTPPGEAPGYLVFTRTYAATVPEEPEPGPDTPSEPGVRTGSLDVTVTADLGKIREDGRGAPAIPRIDVTATDAAGRTKRGQQIEVRGGLSQAMLRADAASLLFRFAALDPGLWTVQARAVGFQTASRAVTVRAGRRTSITIKLRAAKAGGRPAGKSPKPKLDFGWFHPDWFDRGVIVPPEIRWPWPPRDFEEIDPVPGPPEEVLDWAADWAEEIGRRFREAPVDPAEAQIFVDPSHTPDSIAEEPYAFVVFGKGGAYVPLILVPTDASLPRDMALAAGGLPDLDAGMLGSQAGILDMETLAAAWTGLVGDALGLSAATAGTLVSDARSRVAYFRGEGQLDTFHGMSAPLKAALANEGITGAVTLANAEPAVLGARMRERGLLVSDAFAQRLTEQARTTTHADAWSLEAGTIGFDAAEVATLATIGITSQGGLKAMAIDGGLQRVASLLGRDAASLGELVAGLDLSANAAKLEGARKAAAPVTAVSSEVGSADAHRLAVGGFTTVGRLAAADVSAVAAALGSDRARAERLIGLARGQLGGI
jgi:hypothetical protein